MILDDSGASGTESGVSERKPERNDEWVASFLTEFEFVDKDGCSIDDDDDCDAVMFRAGRSECEADGGEDKPAGGPSLFGDGPSCSWPLALDCIVAAAEALSFWKAFASSSILDSDDGLLTSDCLAMVATTGFASIISCSSKASISSTSATFFLRTDFFSVVSLDEVLAVVMERVAVLLLDVVTVVSPSCWFAAASILSLFLGRPRFLTTISADILCDLIKA